MFIYVLVLIVLLASTNASTPDLVVKTKLGELRGFSGESRNGRTYSAFLGIQYGVVEGKRFQVADPVRRWSGVKDALEYGSKCPQTNSWDGQSSLDENCLTLNVFVPEGTKRTTGKQLPVLFYVHGGAWFRGSSADVGEKYFMDEDLVLVTMNYRLGALGFLGVRSPKAPGNVGFTDQVLALKWVRDNIAEFGGDKDRVTIMGNSAGAGSVAHLITSPQTKGYFHGAIHHSGSTLNPWAWRTIEDAESEAIRLGQNLHCDTSDMAVLVDCLLGKDVGDILSAQAKLPTFYVDPLVPFMPVIYPDDPLAFLPENPEDVLREGRFNKVPTIFTYCENEGLLLHAAGIILNEDVMKSLDQNWVKNGGIQMMLDEDGRLPPLSPEQKSQIMGDIRRHYFGQEELKAHDRSIMSKLSAMYTDRHFSYGIRETALAMSTYAPVYVGIFTPMMGADSVTRVFGYNETFGVAHVDDLQFFFDHFGFGPFPLSPELTSYSVNLVKMWANFVHTGVPSATISGSEFSWSRVTDEERRSRKLKWLDLGNIPRSIEDPHGDRLKIWDDLYERFGDENVRDEL